MNDYILALIFLLLALGGVVIRKTYYYIPLHELKRRAEHGEPLARRLYPAAAYGGCLRVLLWLYIGLTSAASIILLARLLPVWASLLIVGPLLWITFSWLPASRVTKAGARLTLIVTPLIVWLLNYLGPLLGRGSNAVYKHSAMLPHTGLFERGDLVELIEQQQRQTDSRLDEHELDIARRALNFNEYKVHDVLVPRKAVKTVLAQDTAGPVLIDELHKNAQGYALVRETSKGSLVGILAFKDLGLQSSGQVKDIMDKSVFYLHENDTLGQALHAFFTNRQPLFVVVNSFEEYVGIITVEGILRQLLGDIPSDGFDQHHDAATVAGRHPKPQKPSKSQKSGKPKKKKSKKEAGGSSVKTDEKVVE
ncbi:MAG TPA: CBS domain-containing protein [Candidatus Saccharimonadales bacterium]|nr:CBS domain-containing protein [Candidatus Saccharimonadales bacterium]